MGELTWQTRLTEDGIERGMADKITHLAILKTNS